MTLREEIGGRNRSGVVLKNIQDLAVAARCREACLLTTKSPRRRR
jgi:hypothetical protein